MVVFTPVPVAITAIHSIAGSLPERYSFLTSPNSNLQHNAGSCPSSSYSPVFEIRSAPAPRG